VETAQGEDSARAAHLEAYSSHLCSVSESRLPQRAGEHVDFEVLYASNELGSL